MPAGLPYFAWIDVGETTFGSEHLRWDEQVFSFNLSQDEGDPASLTIVIRRPRNVAGDAIGLLGPGRKIWVWFALDCGPGLVKFRGRLVGIPTSIFEELVTLEFVARPTDVVAQKAVLADSLRVLPWYDEAVIDPMRASDSDVVLEGYTAIWHYDRETHVVTVSDEIFGEDGVVSFDGASEDGKVLYDGLGLTLTSGPLSRVDVSAEYTWTQQASGTVDLTGPLTAAFPGAGKGIINSYTLTAADWPQSGATLGDGWEVSESTARDLNDYTVQTFTATSSLEIISPDGETTRSTATETTSYIGTFVHPVASPTSGTVISDEFTVDYEKDDEGLLYVASFNRNFQGVHGMFAKQAVQATLKAGYDTGAERQCTERVSLSLFADVQHILTDPEDGEALRIDDIRSVNLDGLIGDSRRRSYICTQRGYQSIEHLIALARAHLIKRARVVEIAFAPKLARMPEITLRKSLFLVEPRVGEATGKIIGYSIALDGSDGRINCEVRVGCAIGRGGEVATTDGTPVYCSIDYVGPDYQQFLGRTILVAAFGDASAGYGPPNADPNDDGINFLSVLRADNVIEGGIEVSFAEPSSVDSSFGPPGAMGGGSTADAQDILAARSEYFKNILKNMETHVSFKLKPMSGQFSTDYGVNVTVLKIPTGYNLEAV